jgi:hypothetical protein
MMKIIIETSNEHPLKNPKDFFYQFHCLCPRKNWDFDHRLKAEKTGDLARTFTRSKFGCV